MIVLLLVNKKNWLFLLKMKRWILTENKRKTSKNRQKNKISDRFILFMFKKKSIE